MDAPAARLEEWPRPLAWFRDFLREELAPYPGRGALVSRMVIAATLVMLVTMTFRLPFGVQAIYALAISRENNWATIKAVHLAILMFSLATVYVVVGTMFSLDDPMLRLLWLVLTLFLGFFALSVIADYATAVGFGILTAVTIPLLDQHISTELKVEQTLWAAGQTILAALIAALLALLFVGLKPGDDLIRPLTTRLAVVEDLLSGYASAGSVVGDAAKKITRLVMLGTSTLRLNIRRTGHAPQYAEQMGAVVALVGRLVDVAGSSVSLEIRVSDDDRQRLRTLVQNVAALRIGLSAEAVPRFDGPLVVGPASPTMPLLPQLERTVSLLAEVLTGSASPGAYVPPLPEGGDPPQRLLVRDAFTNPEHLLFALKGCLAASLCYIIYSALDWPGISTAVITCVLTALTTIGGSRQKQLLRFAGALAGGAIGLAAQIFLLPNLDSIAGFTVLFVAVTLASAWIATSGPRLSYFGIQVANAFYIINLQDFGIQTSLVPVRDRVVGILLGLFMMWLIFDRLWAASTAVQMKKTAIALFRLLAQLAGEPLPKKPRDAIERTYALRETVNGSFNQVRSLADGVWFEFGPSRQQDLALRSRILGWQPQLRMLFITLVSLLKYRLHLPGFELPEPVRLAQSEFEHCLAQILAGLADHLEGKTIPAGSLEPLLARLDAIAKTCESAGTGEPLAANLQTFVPLLRRTGSLAAALNNEIAANGGV